MPTPDQADRASTAPLRTCIGCRTRRSQTDLLRLVRTDEATLLIGRTLVGRGAWLCRTSRQCPELAARSGGFARAFRAPVSRTAVEDLLARWPEPASEPRTDFVPGTPPARDF